MANHNLPLTTSTYANFVAELDARLDDLALGLASDSTTPTNLPTNSIRWNAASKYWEKWSGSAWAALSTSYNININGSVGATSASTGTFTTISTSGVASLGAGSTVGSVAIVTLSDTQTLTNKTLTSPIISSIKNGSAILTLPTSTDTIVGTGTTDTLSNKTLTAPRFASGGYIADNNGNEQVIFITTASAVNEITIGNAPTGNKPTISATGGDTNITLNLVSKGTGSVQANGIDLVNTSGTQTLTNKTLTTPIISSISNTGTLTLPTATDTLVGRSTTDTLSNKTLTAPRFASGGYIADGAGNEQIIFNSTGSAVNEVTITNAAAGTSPSIASSGTDANINLELTAKGTGVVTADGVEVATISGTQTLTNKTWNSNAIAVTYGGTGATSASAARTNLGVPATDGTGASGTWGISINRTVTGTSEVDLVYANMADNDQARIRVGGTATNAGWLEIATADDGTEPIYVRQYTGTFTTAARTLTLLDGSGNTSIPGSLSISGYTAIHSNNYNSYAPSLTGTGASGNWGINITGSSASCTGNAVTATTATTANALNTSNNYQGNSLGVGTAATGTAGEIRATNNITAYYSDDRLKTKLGNITNALEKVLSLNGFYYQANNIAQALGYKPIREVGVSAQAVRAILPEIVVPAPIDEKYLTVRYEKLIPLLIEAIKELNTKLDNLTK